MRKILIACSQFPQRLKLAATLCLAAGTLLNASALPIVYDNLSAPFASLGYLGGSYGFEYLDDVNLAGSARTLHSVTVAYATEGLFDGASLSLTLNLYRMNGPVTPDSDGLNTPGDLLFSSTQSISGVGEVTFINVPGNVILPGTVGVGLVFAGSALEAPGADAGPVIYDPPSIGSSYSDFWLRGIGGSPAWTPYNFGGNPNANFGVRISAVPDTGLSLLASGFLIGALLACGRRRC